MGAVVPALAAAVVALAGATAAAALPADPGPLRLEPGTQLTAAPWKPLARAVSPRLRAPAFARGFVVSPTALALAVTASRPAPVRLFWSVYCESSENDVIFNRQGTVTMRAPFSAYPPIMPGATKCVLTLRATPTSRVKAQVAAFGY